MHNDDIENHIHINRRRDVKSPKDVFDQYLRNENIRHSGQRELVLDVFLRTEKHLTAVELYELVRKKYPKIGYATVYRAMKVICAAGLAEEIDFADGAKRFEHKYGHEHHDHLICLKCGRFVEVIKPEIEKLQEKLARKHGFTLKRHKMHLFGVCGECGGSGNEAIKRR